MKAYSCFSKIKYIGSVTIVSFALMGASAATDFCQQTSHDALEACQDTAEGDQSITLGKCDNVSDPTARADCRKQAAADFKTAMATCKDQFDDRQEARQRRG